MMSCACFTIVPLRIVYNDEELSFQEMLNKDGSVTIHHRNLQKLAIEMYKIKNQISPIPIQKLLTVKEYQYDLRNKNTWVSDNIRTVKYGSETISNMGPKTWELVPNAIKESTSLLQFKSRIENWTSTGCRCRLCKTYIYDVGFLT